jgi:Tfp pilus assembly protein PilF
MNGVRRFFFLLLPLLSFITLTVGAAVPRDVPTVGSVINVKGDGNNLRLIDTQHWLKIELDQALATGDALRTGRLGTLAILFRDDTQIRVHRNTFLEIRYIDPKPGLGGSKLQLALGAVWSRIRRSAGFGGVTFETPAATAAIRGTDWYLQVTEDKTTTLIVLDGNVRFFNEFGSLQVNAGEVATAVIGQAPTKRILVDPKDKPRWVLDLSLEWFNMLPVANLSAMELARDSLEQLSPIQQVEILYDRGNFAAAEKVLAAAMEKSTVNAVGSAESARLDLMRGLLLVRSRQFADAEPLLKRAAAGLIGRQKLIAELSVIGIYVETGRLMDADVTLREIEKTGDESIEVGMGRIWLLQFAGEYDAALERITRIRNRFPGNPLAALLAAQLYLLIDDSEKMDAAISAALKIAPEFYLGWHWRGLYYQQIALDADLARQAYERALKVNPYYGNSWNDYGILLMTLGYYREAESAIRRAVELEPRNALFYAHLGVALSIQESLQEAERAYLRADSLEPNQSDALAGRSILALKRGRNDESTDLILKANVADPALPDGGVLLGTSLYQAGRRVQEAQQTLSNAARLDPNNPLSPLVNSVIALDQARAGDAIRLSREAKDRLDRTGTLFIEGLASSQSGTINVGSAYANLGLHDWGSYYGQLGASPYSANSHFFLSTQYPSQRAQKSSNTQGLLLDPTAVSFPNRYTEFVRQPRHDFSLGGSVGSQDSADFHSADLVVQGFTRLPNPFSYRLITAHLNNEGFRENSANDEQKLLLGLGGWLNSSNYLLFRGNYVSSDEGVPGPESAADLDDERGFEAFRGELGYQYRINAQNRILVRLGGEYARDEFTNARPLGTGLSDLDFSLINAFGFDFVRNLYEAGLYSLGFLDNPDNPVLVAGPAGEIFGLPRLEDRIPPGLDLKNLRSHRFDQHSVTLQARHMLKLGNVDLSYGAEVGAFNENIREEGNVLSHRGLGGILDAGTGLLPESPLFFLFGSPRLERGAAKFKQRAAVGYFDGQWESRSDLRIQAGAYLRYFDDDIDDSKTQIDPRIGIAWQPLPNHWLRAAAQREFILPFGETLAPVATVGLVATEDYLSRPLTSPWQVGGEITDFQVRWDAEWSPYFYTFTKFEEQQVEDYFQTISLANILTTFFAVDKGKIRNLSIGANIWFADCFGLFAIYNNNHSENRSHGPNQGNDLPLIPDETLDFGLTYVDPRQVRATISQTYVGERSSDLEGVSTLDGFWTTGLQINWQPKNRHWSLTLGVDDLFDRGYEIAEDFPSPGRTTYLAVEYRY